MIRKWLDVIVEDDTPEGVESAIDMLARSANDVANSGDSENLHILISEPRQSPAAQRVEAIAEHMESLGAYTQADEIRRLGKERDDLQAQLES